MESFGKSAPGAYRYIWVPPGQNASQYTGFQNVEADLASSPWCEVQKHNAGKSSS